MKIFYHYFNKMNRGVKKCLKYGKKKRLFILVEILWDESKMRRFFILMNKIHKFNLLHYKK